MKESTTPATDQPGTGAPPAVPRFSWPMRLLLGLLLIMIVVRNFTALAPCEKWRAELAMEHYPKALPSWDELQSLTRDALLKMAVNARKLGKPNATQAIAAEIEEVALS